MDFEDIFNKKGELTEEEDIEDSPEDNKNHSKENSKIGQNQFYGIITSKKPDWQTIIYDLIHTEQLDPWDIDLIVLTNRYFERIYELEEDPDFYASSRILLAAALLLRIKSEFLLNKHIRSIDEILFGKKEESKPVIERIEIDEDELPILIPKTPLPRARRVTLQELMTALNKAINTETRRIKREVAVKQADRLSHVDIPAFRRIDLKDRIKQFYARILTAIKRISSEKKEIRKVGYHELIGKEREEKLASFLPLLHLSNSRKLWLEQEGHLDEIWIFLYEYFEKNREDFMKELELDEDIEESESLSENIDKTQNPLEKARKKREAKKRLQEEIKKELEGELGITVGEEIEDIAKEKKIEETTGFSDEY